MFPAGWQKVGTLASERNAPTLRDMEETRDTLKNARAPPIRESK
jgi:hypothetical protein